MFHWASDIGVYIIPEELFSRLDLPFTWLDSPKKISNLEILLSRMRTKKLDEYEIYGELYFENGAFVLIPRAQTFLKKITPSSAIIGATAGLGLGPTAIVAGAAIAINTGRKVTNLVAPRRDLNSESISRIFDSDNKFALIQAKYKIKLEDLIYSESNSLSVVLTDRVVRSEIKKFFDVDGTADRGLNIFIGNFINKDSIKRCLAFFISKVQNDDTINTLVAQGFKKDQFTVVSRIEKKSWSPYSP